MADDAGEDRVLTLSENFRSEKSVIDRINAIFKGKIMPEYPDKDYEAQYKSLVSNVHKTSLSQMRFTNRNTLHQVICYQTHTNPDYSQPYSHSTTNGCHFTQHHRCLFCTIHSSQKRKPRHYFTMPNMLIAQQCAAAPHQF